MKDMLGNEMHVGQRCVFNFSNSLCVGKILKINRKTAKVRFKTWWGNEMERLRDPSQMVTLTITMFDPDEIVKWRASRETD